MEEGILHIVINHSILYLLILVIITVQTVYIYYYYTTFNGVGFYVHDLDSADLSFDIQLLEQPNGGQCRYLYFP